MRVLGIDTSLRSTGVAVVEASGSRLQAVEYGVLKMPPKRRVSDCLAALSGGIGETIERTSPDAAAVEGAFYCRNVRTAMVLGQARGAAIAVCAGRDLPVFEYSPRKVKQAVVGFGGADKSQVRRMVMSICGLDEEPEEDAADALAIAISHFHNLTGYAELMPKEI